MLLSAAGAFAGEPSDAAKPTELVSKVCSACHTLDRITKKQATTEEWRGIVKTMVDKGAPLKADEVSAVTEYLASKYGRPKTREERGKDLVESVCILCHEFARISTEQLTRDAWAGEIRGMLAEGAPLNDEEFDIVLDYLTEHYGPKQ